MNRLVLDTLSYSGTGEALTNGCDKSGMRELKYAYLATVDLAL